MKSELIAIRLDKELAQMLKSDIVPVSQQVRAAIKLFLQYPKEQRYDVIRKFELDKEPTSSDLDENTIAMPC